ncbi:MAG: putative selenium-dependent hydroxylase accessory protein YqeC [Candidatus Latescibacteria bacterium]|nr:putative selenium-dependent hydroxylase accessory protein YqeC [Candidatus Latescibacterota bacterium]
MLSFLDTFGIHRGDVVSVVGSGGKATLMYHLAAEGLGRGDTVMTTSSTHLHPPTSRQSNGMLVTAEDPDWSARLRERLTREPHLTIVGDRVRPDKMRGLDFGALDTLRAVCPAALLLIKADGARTRPFKAPGADEPVVPVWTTHCVIVVGLHSVGLPLDERFVHRPERVTALTGLRPGQPLTCEVIGRVVSHPQAYARKIPVATKTILYLGWCGDAHRRRLAEEICRSADPVIVPHVLCGNIEGERGSLAVLR